MDRRPTLLNWTELSEYHQRRFLSLYRRMNGYNVAMEAWMIIHLEEERFLESLVQYRILIRLPVYYEFASDVKAKPPRDDEEDPDDPAPRMHRKQNAPQRRLF